MKSHKIIITNLFLSILLFSGCTSKYQTNKLPNEEKVMLPTKIKKRVYYLNQDIKDDFKKYVLNEFNDGQERKVLNTKKHEESKLPQGLWTEGYKLDKKRY